MSEKKTKDVNIKEWPDYKGDCRTAADVVGDFLEKRKKERVK